MQNKYWFKSPEFKLQNGEEELTNPGCYGKSLAEWLASEFSKIGYKTEVIPEDWGWCVMCVRDEYLLWIGCGSMMTDEILEKGPAHSPNMSTIVWHVFTEIEVPFFKLKSRVKKWFGQLDLSAPQSKLNLELGAILESNKSIHFCDEP